MDEMNDYTKDKESWLVEDGYDDEDEDGFANPHTLGLSKGRFTSSGDQLPIERIIARVLADPTEDDIKILYDEFGLDAIMIIWQTVLDRRDVAESVIPITNLILSGLHVEPDIPDEDFKHESYVGC